MPWFFVVVGVIAALCMIGAVLNAAGSENAISAAVSTGHAIELAILTVVCLVGAGVLGALGRIAGTLDEIAGKPKPPEPPPFGQKSKPAPVDAMFAEPEAAPDTKPLSPRDGP
jgi:hypothetical protein